MAAGSIVVDLLMRTGSFETDTKRAEKSLQSFKKEADKIGSAIGTGLAGVAVGVATGFVAMVKSQTAAIDAFNDLKDATGASIENISALDDVARRTGADFATVEQSLIKFNQALGSAKPGSDAEQAIRMLGLSVKELKALDPAEALLKTAIALNGFADNGNKARIVQELLGKSLKEVAPLLKDLAEKGELVAKTTTQQAEEAEKFRKTLFELKANSEDFGRSLVNSVVPSINETIKRFKEGAAAGQSFFGTLARLQLEAIGFTGSNPALEADRIKALTKLLEDQNLPVERRIRLEAQLAALQAKNKFSPAAGGGRGFVNPDPVKPSVGDLRETPKKATTSEAQRYLEMLQKQGEKVSDLTVLEQALLDVQKGRLEGITPKLKEQILAQATIVDQLKYEEQQRKSLEDAIVAVRDARLQGIDAAVNEGRSLKEANDALSAEIGFIGLSVEAHDAVEQARLSSAIALKEEALAAVTSEEANAGLSQALRDQIEQLQRRQKLLGNKSSAEAFAAQMKEQEDSLRNVRDTIEGTIGQGLEDALDGNFKNIGDSFAKLLKRMIAESLAADITKSLFGKSSGTNSVGSFSSLLQQWMGGSGFGTGVGYGSQDIGGYLAEGGPAASGKAYVVGESGPELFLPTTSGRVLPNDRSWGGGGTKVIIENHGARIEKRTEGNGDVRLIVEAAVAEVDRRIASGTGSTSAALKSRGVNLSGNLPRRS